MAPTLFKLTILICMLADLNAYDSNTYFVNSANMTASDQYNLYWNYTLTDITFKAVVKSSGWLGFGLSPNGGMPFSDLIVVYSNLDSSVNRYIASGESLPVINSTQYWSMLYYSQLNGFTTVIFTRKLTVCNIPRSINIQSGPQYVIFAWGDSFSYMGNSKDIQYHSPSNRSSYSLPLINTLNTRIALDMSQIETVDFIVNGSLSNDSDTTYFCQMFKLPDSWTQAKRHLVRYDTLLALNTSQYVHHWVLYECSMSYNQMINGSWPAPGNCLNDPVWLDVSTHCLKISLAWAIGGYINQYMPQNVAYPLGGPQADFKYFFLQMHYNNPNKVQGVTDNSGIRFYVTQNYRPIEFGVLTIGGDTSSYAITLPPQANLTGIDFYCRNNVTNYLFNLNVSNITILATMPHSHLAGRQIVSKIVRNATEIAYLSNAQYYDFDHQYINFLNPPLNMYPNDELKVTCVYSTLDRTGFTVGGPTTHDEMCLDFLWYYPRSPSLSVCTELTAPASWTAFNNELNKTGNITTYLQSMGFLKTQQLFQNFYANSIKVQSYLHDGELSFSVYPPSKVKAIVENNLCLTLTTPSSPFTSTNQKPSFSTPANQSNIFCILIAMAISLAFN